MAAAKELLKKDTLKNTGLKKCFTALVDRKQVNLDIEVLKLMLKKELQINLESLDEQLASVMPLMLVTYMKTWPGWQRSKEYFSGKLNFKEWYEKFRQYIVLRLNFLIKNGYNMVVEEIKSDVKAAAGLVGSGKAFTEHGTQTDSLAPKGFAPFSISIDCPPYVLNSVVFTDTGDDIIIRQHPDIQWSKIDTKQLIHWPNVEVEFFSPELSFRRTNSFEFNRYINFVNTPLTYEKCEYVEQVEIMDPSSGRNCYTLKMLRCYVKQYVSILRSSTIVEEKHVDNIQVLFNEFLKDIEEIDMNNTMATNTSVLFNIGKCAFLRNKKISRGTFLKTGSNTDVGFCEIIIPKMLTSLCYFKGVQDMNTSDVSFSYLNIIKGLIANNSNATLGTAVPVITYKCTYCNIKFKSDTGILTHLELLHKMDPNVLCIKCKKSYTIGYLTNMRWKHVCNTTPTFQSKQPIVIK